MTTHQTAAHEARGVFRRAGSRRFALLLAASAMLQDAAADFGTLDGPLEIEAIQSGASGNGASFAILTNVGGASQVRTYGTAGSVPSFVADLNDHFEYLDLEPVEVAGTTTALAVLAKAREGAGLRVFRVDLDSGRISSSEPFGASYEAVDMEVGLMPDGSSVAFLLARSRAANRSRILFHRDGRLEQIAVERYLSANDLEFAEDPDSNAPLLIVLGDVLATRASRVIVYDAETMDRVSTISFGRHESLDLSVATHDEQLALSVLRKTDANQPIRIESRTLDARRVAVTTFPHGLEPRAFVDRASNRSSSLQAVLTAEPDSARASIEFETPHGSGLFRTVEFGSGSLSASAAELSPDEGIDSHHFAVAQQHRLTESLQVKLRSPANVRQITIPLNRSERVPDWFRHNRVHGHTRLSDVDQRIGLEGSWYRTDQSLNAGAYFGQLGARVFTRHAKASNEDPWWPSMAPPGPNGTSRYSQARDNKGLAVPADANFTQGYIDEAWRAGLPMLAYYADSGESTLADEHPEWVCRKQDGNEATHQTKGRFLDLTTAYGDIVRTRILELADMGAGGVYLDFRHAPANGCWSTELEAGYTARFGVPAPSIGNTDAYRRYVEYFASRTVEVIEGWARAVKAEYPEFQMLVSVTSVPALTRLDMSSRLAAVGTPKSEFAVAVARGQSNSVFERFRHLHRPPDDIRQAMGWSLLRDVAGENLFHVWTAFMPNGDHVRTFVSSIVAYGGVAALDLAGGLLAPGSALDGIATREDMRQGFALGQELSRELGRSTPLRWGAVHFSERARNQFVTDTEQAWSHSLLATVGSFEALRRNGIPVKIVTDEMLEGDQLDGVRFLVLPNPEALSDDAASTVLSFETRGGDVHRVPTTDEWATTTSYEDGKALVAAAALSLADPPAARSAGLLPDGVHVTFARSEVDSGLIVTAINRFDFVQASTIFDPLPASEVNPTPPAVAPGIELLIAEASLPFPQPSGADSWHVTDTLNGATLPYERTNDGIAVALPSFDRVLQLVVR